MNDWWNDPPDDDPELPPCPKCGSAQTDIETTGDDALICGDCDHSWTPAIEPDPKPEDFGPMSEEYPPPDDDPPEPAACPHSNPPGECDACDYLADEAFDAARERGRR